MEIASREEIQALAADVKDLKRMFNLFLIQNKLPQTVSVADIARIEGKSISYLCNNGAYLLPRYGVSGYPEKRNRRWDYQEFLDWQKIPAEERKMIFEKSQKHKKKCLTKNG